MNETEREDESLRDVSLMKSVIEVLRGNLLIFTLGHVLRQLSLFITFPYFSLYIQSLNGNIADIGLVNSLYPLTALFMYPIAGYVTDRYSRIKIIGISGCIYTLLYLLFTFAPDWRFIALGNFLMGILIFQFPAMNSLMADSLPPSRRGVGYSLYMAIPSGVGIFSPYIGGYLITIFGVEWAMRCLYGLSAMTTLGIAMIDLKFLRENTTVQRAEESGKGLFTIVLESYRNMLEVLRWLPRRMRAFTLMLILSFFINNFVSPYWIVYGLEQIKLSELQWGTMLFAAAIVNVLLLVPAGMIVDRFSARGVLTFAFALSAFPILLFPLSTSFVETTLCFVIVTIANAFLASAAPAFMAQAVPSERRGRVMAALGQGTLFISTMGGSGGPSMGAILTVPSMLGSIVGGFMYGYAPSSLWLLLALFMAINSVLSVLFLSTNT